MAHKIPEIFEPAKRFKFSLDAAVKMLSRDLRGVTWAEIADAISKRGHLCRKNNWGLFDQEGNFVEERQAAPIDTYCQPYHAVKEGVASIPRYCPGRLMALIVEMRRAA